MNVSRLLDPIQEAAALLDARNATPQPSTAELRRIERYLAKALILCRRELKRRDREHALPNERPHFGGTAPHRFESGRCRYCGKREPF